MVLLNGFFGEEEERQPDLPKIKVDIYELHNYEKDYDYPDHHTTFPFTVHLFKALAVADVGNFENLATVYPEESYMIAYKEKPQFLHYFVLWDRINEVESNDWK